LPSDNNSSTSGLSRRAFLGRSTAAGAAALVLPATAQAQDVRVRSVGSTRGSSYVDLLRVPDRITAYCGLDDSFALSGGGEHWTGRSVELTTTPANGEVGIRLLSPKDALTHLHLRWAAPVSTSVLCLGDAWERSYGELAWRGMVPEQAMPWYFATWDGMATHGYGVKTGASALCFWQMDPEGVSLWLDVSNGGSGVMLGERTLVAATVVARQGQAGEDSIEAVRLLCRKMCAKPRPSPGPIYGSNDWYYAYGHSSPEAILRDADLVASLRPAGAPKPFTVVDDGWQNKAKFPDMAAFAATIKSRGARPGMWERPLRAPKGTKPGLLMAAARFGERSGRATALAYDPTVPDALHLVTETVRTIRSWGFEMLKHDYTTYDMLGQWGFEMAEFGKGARPTLPGWSFHDRSRTNAEIILDLYKAIRATAGEEMLIISCDTFGHLGAGIFEIQRTGDDISGKIWERTRRMGINTLAFRIPQHGSFFVVDADCVAITQAVPWEPTRQWLDLVARSGTALFVSPEAAAMGSEQKKALAEAFVTVTAAGAASVPADWFHSTTPEVWRESGNKAEKRYEWCSPDGAYPFGV
jgi:alpha-galactosidase